MSKSILIPDIHLGKTLTFGKVGIGSALNSRIVDQFNLLDWAIERAQENDADNIIIVGDTFESPTPPPYLFNMFLGWLKKCQIHNIKVHIILGNHCILRNGNNYTSVLDAISEVEMESIFVYKDLQSIIIDNTSFTLMPFRDRKSLGATSNAEGLEILKSQLSYELAAIPDTLYKVIAGHLAIEGSIPIGDEIDDLTNELFCPISMFDGFSAVFMGHIHKPQVMHKANPYIAHIGSMDISNFGEADHKKHIVVFDCENQSWFHETIPTRALQKISIVIPKEIEDTTSYVLNEIKKMDISDKGIVKVEVSLTSPELLSVNKATIEKALLERGVFSVNNISETKKVKLIKKEGNNDNISSKMEITSAIKLYAENRVDKHLQAQYTELSLEVLNNAKTEGKL